MNTPPELTIIILNYKTKGLLKQCLRGIKESNLAMATEVIVVDNNSKDGSVAMVEEIFPDIKIVISPTNVGFAAGANLGLRLATGRYLMILNTDVAIFRGAVEQLHKYLVNHPTAGIVAPKLINPDGTTQLSCYRFPNFIIPILRRTPLGKLPWAKKILRSYLMSDWDHQNTRPIGWALGACLMVRRVALDQVGIFDERFFLYFEDVDLCRRFWQRGWEVWYVSDAEMVHYHRRLSAESPGLTGLFSYPTRVHIISGLKYFAKYYGAVKPAHHL